MATPLPDLNIPSSPNTVSVSIIDTTSHVVVPSAAFFVPTIPGNETLYGCCYSFLIKHSNPAKASKYDTLLWDLGVRKDWENSPKVIADQIKSFPPGSVTVEKNVSEILEAEGVDLKSVGGIIWSHHHLDHTGDPNTFPSSTDLIVGPGFKKAFTPAYPTDETSQVDERFWAERELVEISFDDSPLRIGDYSAHDLYGDGSLYLLNTPGHAIGHICALARTRAEPPEFMFLGGDIAHHGGEFRPTEYLPLPKDIRPNPIKSATAATCPGSLFEQIHPEKSSTKPFHRLTEGGAFHDHAPTAQESLDKMHPFDAHDNIFVAIAHDTSLYDVYEYFPKPANDWKAKGWKEEGTWKFLGDYTVEEPRA